MKIKVYILIAISTDDCTYCSYDYEGVFPSEEEAEKKKEALMDYHIGTFEIREEFVDNPEIINES
jgi:hypothetical protein